MANPLKDNTVSGYFAPFVSYYKRDRDV